MTRLYSTFDPAALGASLALEQAVRQADKNK